MTFDEARAAFPVLERVAYLNAGTFGPLARATVAAMQARETLDLECGRGGARYFDDLMAIRQAAREPLAGLLGVPATHLALTSSTTDGCNIVLAGLGLDTDDEIVTTDEEHFGLLGPLHASGATVRVAPVDGVLDAVTRRTRLLALSHVSWMSGRVLPVRELKTESGLPVLVDGAQSVGAIGIDAGDVDFYTVSGQKWLCGPDATGALYVRDPERLRVARPSYFAQQRYEPAGAFEPRLGAARFDSGWIPLPSLAGLVAAIDAAPAWRFERTLEMAGRCRALLEERYEVVTPPSQAGLVSFRPPDDPPEVVRRLHDRGVVVRDLPNTGLVRVSCGYWTSDGDLERLAEALAAYDSSAA